MATRLKPISNDLILSTVKYENPWWLSGEIDAEYQVYQRRLYFDLFFPLVEETEPRRAVVLMGPRRVGKTVMMYHAIEQLLQKTKIPGNKICLISVENPLYV